MSETVFAPPATPTVAVAGRPERFPVRRICCVGRNYAAHAREFGNDPDREPPFFFTKPADAVVEDGTTIPYPQLTNDLHHEIEFVVAIGKAGRDIPVESALDHVWGYAVGIDLTRRDLQNKAKEMRRPWDWAKAFDNSAPCGAIRPAAEIGHPVAGRIHLAVNGAMRQDADLADLIWPVPDVIAHCSRAMRLAPGDLIYTGTPAGVGAIGPGDVMTSGIDGIGTIEIRIGEREGAT